MTDPGRAAEVEFASQIRGILAELAPAVRLRLGAEAVPAHVECDGMAMGYPCDDLVPAAGVEARGVGEENRRFRACALKNGEPCAVNIKETGTGHNSRGTTYGSR